MPAYLKRLLQCLNAPGPRLEPIFFVVSVLALLIFSGYFQVKLADPADITGDHLFLLTSAKSMIDGYGPRLDPKLGFPAPRDWAYFPIFDVTYLIATQTAARFTANPFTVVHMVYIAGLSAMGCAYYWVLRRLDISAWLAVIGALAAAVTPFLQERMYVHDSIALSFSVPLGFGLALQIGRDGSTMTLRKFLLNPLVWISLLIIGTSGLYYAFYSVLIAGFVGVAVSIGDRRLAPLLAALVIAETTLILLVLSGYGPHVPSFLTGKGPIQPQRAAFEQLMYGLNLAGAADRLGFVHKVALGMADTKRFLPISIGDGGQWPALPLTLTILAAPLVSAAGQARLKTLDEPAASKLRVVVLCAAVIVFLLLFGARGGIGYIFNLVAMPQIRSDARVMPFLIFGAVVILCLLAEIGRDNPRRWVRYAAPAVVSVLLLGSTVGTIGVAARMQSANLSDPKVQVLRASVPNMLAAKDRAMLKTVLQLPVLGWPEALWPREGYNPYQQQLPYIFDVRNSPTRWSYGASDKQAGFKRLQAQTRTVEGLVDRARGMGFDSILLEKGGYDPKALAAAQISLASQVGGRCKVYEDQTYALYSLNCA